MQYKGLYGLKAGIDVSQINNIDITATQDLFSNSGNSNSMIDIAQNALIVLGGLSVYFLDSKPQGSCVSDLVDIRKSSIPGASLGLYATKTIPEGTVIGTFPGFVKPVEEAIKQKIDDNAIENAKRYFWALNSVSVLDPTNEQGGLDLEISFFFGLFKVDTSIARINEPPKGGDCNVFTRTSSDGKVIEVVAEKDIFANTEIFMDYGRSYNRDDYTTTQSDIDKELLMMEKEKEDMMKFQPVVVDSDSDMIYDQDTTNRDGFISKLSQKASDDDAYDSMGILQPSEGMKAFTKQGSNMFRSKEDQELVAAIEGNKNSNSDILGSRKGEEESNSKVGNNDDDLISDLRAQLGKDAKEITDDDKNLFDDFVGTKIPTASSTASPSSSSSSSTSPSPPPQPKMKKMLEDNEAEDLQRRIDAMTDEQLEKVFAKMRSTMGDKLEEELGKKLKEKMNESYTSRKLSESETANPELRKKYSEELELIEEELEKMANDPLSVWSALATDPTKYLENDGDK